MIIPAISQCPVVLSFPEKLPAFYRNSHPVSVPVRRPEWPDIPHPKFLHIGKVKPADSFRGVTKRICTGVSVCCGVRRFADADTIQDDENDFAGRTQLRVDFLSLHLHT